MNNNGSFNGWCGWGANNSTNANSYRFAPGSPNLVQNYWYDGANDYNTTFLPSNNTWYNIAYTWNGSNTASLYINGVAYTTKVRAAINVTVVSPSNPLRIGVDTLNSVLSGNIAFAQIYNVALSQADVTAVFNSTKTKFGY